MSVTTRERASSTQPSRAGYLLWDSNASRARFSGVNATGHLHQNTDLGH